MWGSAFAASLDDVFLKVVGSGLSFLESLGDVVKVIGKERSCSALFCTIIYLPDNLVWQTMYLLVNFQTIASQQKRHKFKG